MPTKISSVSASSHPALAKRPPPRELSIGGFDEHNENLHGVEFEAPFSTESQKPPLTKGRFSIDFSIELERQLERMETSPPSSPPAAATMGTHGNMNANMLGGGDLSITEGQSSNSHDGNVASISHSDKDLLDPEILAHIITQLRQSLSEMTKEKDELVKMLARVNAEEANVKDALQLMTEKATQAEEDLGEAKKRMKEDEEQIALLRAKVDESRRGLMRLQTESRRQSMTPIDISRASSLAAANFGNPSSAKRTSFTPLTGSRHGRIPSPDNNLVSPDHIPGPNTHCSSGDAGLSPNPPYSSRRFSGLFGRISPGIPDNESDAQPPLAEVETLKAEVKSLKSDLESVKHELVEANEAKEASETCVKALREFIAENNIGALAVKLPPLPTMASSAQDVEPKKIGSGWGFKLWGSGPGGPSTNSGPSTTNGGVMDPQDAAIPPPMSSETHGVSPTPLTTVPTPTSPAPAPAPLSRKLTGLFSSRSSISRGQAKLGSNAGTTSSPLIDRTNSAYSNSDVSGVVEPMSPVMVNDAANSGVVKPLGEDRVARETLTDLDRPSNLVGGVEGGQQTPPSLYEVDLDGGLK